MRILTYTEYENEYQNLIDNYQSFVISVMNVSDMLDISSQLESYIESKHLTCRIYTKNRWLTALSGLTNKRLGLFSLALIAAHNIMTYNPDYEIARDLANNRISVVYQK